MTSEPNTQPEKDDDYTPPGQLSNQQRVEELDKEIADSRDKLKAQLEAEEPSYEEKPEEKPEVSPEKEVSPDSKTAPSSETPPATYTDEQGRLRDSQTHKFVGKSGERTETPQEEVKAEAPAEQETPYQKASKAEKDAARLARVVEQRQRESEQLARERDEWRARAQQGQQPQGRDQGGETTRFNSEQFQRAADEFAEQGFKHLQEDDTEQALEAFNWAKKAQQSAQQAYQAEAQQAEAAEQEGFIRTWQETVQSVIEEAKTQGIDLNDEGNEDAQALVEILETEPILNYLPDGFRKTWELHQLRKTYAEAPQLRDRIKELEKELSRYTKVNTPSSGSRARPSGPKKFEDMDMGEQRAYLKRKQYEENG